MKRVNPFDGADAILQFVKEQGVYVYTTKGMFDSIGYVLECALDRLVEEGKLQKIGNGYKLNESLLNNEKPN